MNFGGSVDSICRNVDPSLRAVWFRIATTWACRQFLRLQIRHRWRLGFNGLWDRSRIMRGVVLFYPVFQVVVKGAVLIGLVERGAALNGISIRARGAELEVAKKAGRARFSTRACFAARAGTGSGGGWRRRGVQADAEAHMGLNWSAWIKSCWRWRWLLVLTLSQASLSTSWWTRIWFVSAKLSHLDSNY